MSLPSSRSRRRQRTTSTRPPSPPGYVAQAALAACEYVGSLPRAAQRVSDTEEALSNFPGRNESEAERFGKIVGNLIGGFLLNRFLFKEDHRFNQIFKSPIRSSRSSKSSVSITAGSLSSSSYPPITTPAGSWAPRHRTWRGAVPTPSPS